MKVDAQKEFEESFRLLHTDYFDIYHMHALSREEEVDQAFGDGGVMEMMVKAKEQGLVDIENKELRLVIIFLL